MKTLIIYAHPNDKSYNASILETIKENLSSKHELKVLDLYKNACADAGPRASTA